MTFKNLSVLVLWTKVKPQYWKGQHPGNYSIDLFTPSLYGNAHLVLLRHRGNATPQVMAKFKITRLVTEEYKHFLTEVNLNQRQISGLDNNKGSQLVWG